MILYLIRHGQTDWNTVYRMQGQTDVALNATGVEQSKQLAVRLKDGRLSKLYTSPLSRALMTGKIIGDRLKLECVTVPELMEFNFGVWQGMTYDEIKQKYQEQWHAWLQESWKVKIPGAENFKEGMTRIVNTINRIVDENNDNIAIVTHGTSIEFYINYIQGKAMKEIKMEQLVGKNGSITKVRIDQKNHIMRIGENDE